MTELVILTEEPSIKPVFERLAECVDLNGATIRIIPHQGASDLEKSLPRKLRAWTNPNARFLIVRDNDSGDCTQRKSRLMRIVQEAGRQDRALVRIVCQELEAWFLGDRQAMHDAGVLLHNDNPASLRRAPDTVDRPSQVLDQHLRGYTKIQSARQIAQFLEPDRNTSPSFQATIAAMRRLTED